MKYVYMLGLSVILLVQCRPKPPEEVKPVISSATPEDPAVLATGFITSVEKDLRPLVVAASRADFLLGTFTNYDTEKSDAAAQKNIMSYFSKILPEVAKHKSLTSLPTDIAYKLYLLSTYQVLPAPTDPQAQEALANTQISMLAAYNKFKYTPSGSSTALSINDIKRGMADKDAAKLKDLWLGWHNNGKQIRDSYAKYVELANQGARELGYADLGALWKSTYDMPAQDFEKEVERLWTEVKPLYSELQCYTREKLKKVYPNQVSSSGLIPAQLVGNIWTQDWKNLYPLLAPTGSDQTKIDTTKLLKDAKVDAKGMIKLAEKFYTSMGLDKLPETFWERSMFEDPKNREVDCQASTTDVESNGDLRLKMCVEVNDENLHTAHHELGHAYYFWYYRNLPLLYQQGAHDGFHEAIGDTLALSINPTYLQQVGLLKDLPPTNPQQEIGQLLGQALNLVVFLPYGKVLDQWRWDVFSGKITKENYNSSFWALRKKYQGIEPPVARTEADFDPGAKFHIPGNVPYIRYFLSHILQYQFYQTLCQAAGHKGPLHQCSIYGSKAAGDKLKTLFEMGRSRPWQDVLQSFSGERKMSAKALLEYYAPLYRWLKQQNQGKSCGWTQ